MYFVAEGMDHVGKSKQIELLKARLEASGREVVVVREPGSTPLAEDLRGCIKRIYDARTDYMEHLLMFTAARYSLLKHVIKPALAEGKVVISDRCWISSLFYQVMMAEPATQARDAAMDVLRVPLDGAPRPHILVMFNDRLRAELTAGRDALEDVDGSVDAMRHRGYMGLTGRAEFQDADARMVVNSYTATISHIDGDLLSVDEIHEMVYSRFCALESTEALRPANKGIFSTMVG